MSERRPFFSVIIPAHNSERYIRKGLDSIRMQDFRDYELIVVCDSCTDDTDLAAAAYTENVIRTDFHSAGGGRNAGLDAARGEWILFMDDDDWYISGAFRKIAEAIRERPGIDVLCYGFEWKGVGTRMQNVSRRYPAVWTKAWRADFIGEKRFPVWQHTEDVEFNRIVMPGARCGYLLEALYYYNFLREGSVSDRIRKGEYDNSLIPENCREQAEGYERWLKGRDW